MGHRFRIVWVWLLSVAVLTVAATASAQSHTSKPFQGPKANTGTVTHTVKNGMHTLTLSDDFKVPDTPDPHWQVVDTKGKVYNLERLMAKENKYNKSITLPAYIPDVAKVVIWCAWAETNLGETTFDMSLKLTN